MTYTTIDQIERHPGESHAVTSGNHRISAGRMLRWLTLMLDVARQRRQLQALDDRMLKDIGLSRSLAAAEARRSVFDLPGARGWLG